MTRQKLLWQKVATLVPSEAGEESYKWLGKIPRMREWIGDRQIQNLTASDYTIKNKDFEVTVGVDRNDIEDDKNRPLYADNPGCRTECGNISGRSCFRASEEWVCIQVL